MTGPGRPDAAGGREVRPAALRGPLAFVGGGEHREGTTFDAELLAASGAREVVVVPTAAAYERPERLVAQASAWFSSLGATVRACMVLARPDAGDPRLVEMLAAARFVYLCGRSPLHLRSVLKDSTALAALAGAWRSGAVVAGSSAAAMALSDPMVDPRGGAFTVGLGFVSDLAVVPHPAGELSAQLRRTIALAPAGCPIVVLPDRTALIRDPAGTWRLEGLGVAEATVHLDGLPADLTALAGKRAGWPDPPPG